MADGILYTIEESDDVGRHVISCTDIAKGDTILSEKPIVFLNKLTPCQESCAACGRVLGLPSDILQRGEHSKLEDEVLACLTSELKALDADTAVPPVECSACRAVFCGEDCRASHEFFASAFEAPGAHQVCDHGEHPMWNRSFFVCAPRMSEAAQKAYASYVEQYSLNERFVFLFKHCAGAVATLQLGCAATAGGVREDDLHLPDYDDGSMRIGVTQGVRVALREASSLMRAVFFAGKEAPGREAAIVTPQSLLRLLNIYNVNCHTTSTLSPLHALQHSLLKKGGHDGLRGRLAAAFELLPEAFLVKGAGLLRDAACVNHSCAPNCKVVPSMADTRVEMVALRSIPRGTELHISYIDSVGLAGRPWARQRELQSYNFTCVCPACCTEVAVHVYAWVAAALASVAASYTLSLTGITRQIHS
eukprot:Rhum_TRINITY_DN11466_c0_g1::Rhum_TRINITY_DN11466_c0_g1_i1::g.44772::m.44772